MHQDTFCKSVKEQALDIDKDQLPEEEQIRAWKKEQRAFEEEKKKTVLVKRIKNELKNLLSNDLNTLQKIETWENVFDDLREIPDMKSNSYLRLSKDVLPSTRELQEIISKFGNRKVKSEKPMETKFEFTFENRSKKRQRDGNNQGQEDTSGRVKKGKSTRKQPRDDRRDSPRHSEARSSRQVRRGDWRENDYIERSCRRQSWQPRNRRN